MVNSLRTATPDSSATAVWSTNNREYSVSQRAADPVDVS